MGSVKVGFSETLVVNISVRKIMLEEKYRKSMIFYIAPCKGIRISESGKFLHLESGILEIFARGIRNPGPWNPEYRCRNPESH